MKRFLDVGKAWAGPVLRGSPEVVGIARRMWASTDRARLDGLREEMREAVDREPTCAAKYADYRYWIPFNAERVAALGLHGAMPLRILDIGCGPGYFLSAARACGHSVNGVDIPSEMMTVVEQRAYGELLAAQSLTDRVSPLLVNPFEPLPLETGGYDLITAFWICFNRHRQPQEWGAREWSFFLDDARSRLRSGGTLHLELNEHPERYGDLRSYDAETLAVFTRAGVVKGNVVRIAR